MNSDVQRTKIELISCCFEGDLGSCKDALESLEVRLGRPSNPGDFTPQQDPLIAACLGKHYGIAAYLIEHGVSQVTENTVSLAEPEIPHLMRVWNRQQQDGKLEATWNSKHLHVFRASWLHFPVYKSNLVTIDVSRNDLSVIPGELLWGLPELQKLDVSYNKLQCLPGPVEEERKEKSRLKELYVSSNHLFGVPTEIFQLKNLQILELHNNHIISLDPTDSVSRLGHHGPEEIWACPNLSELNLKSNNLETLPKTAIVGASGLKKLRISRNRLTTLPPSWRCPLETLEASENEINGLYDMHEHWSLTLETVDLSHNHLTEIPDTICKLTALDSLNVSNNVITKLPLSQNWGVFKLHTLNLARNRLSFSEKFEMLTTKEKRSSRMRASSASDTLSSYAWSSPDGEFDFLNGLKDDLKHLDLSGNLLEAVPPCVCRLHRLLDLDLSGNEKLTKLPNELAMLKNMIGLRYPKGLKEPKEVVEIIQDEAMTRKGDKILAALTDRLYKSEPYRGMKMIVVGPTRGGKTALVSNLVGDPQWPADADLVNTYQWALTNPNKSSLFIKKKPAEEDKITFTIWDLKGGDIYDTIQPCLYTNACLYLLVWDGSEGAKSVDNLKHYVADIKQRAKHSEIILVATHSENIRLKADKEDELRARIRKDFNDQHLHLVSSSGVKKSDPAMQNLRNFIFQRATNATMRIGRSVRSESNIIGRKIPKAFLQLKTKLEEQTRHIIQRNISATEKTSLILTRSTLQEQIQRLVDRSIVRGDIYGILREALDFLSVSGTVLPVRIRSGRELIILDPLWLCGFLREITQISDNQLQERLCRKSILSTICSKFGSKDSSSRDRENFFQMVEGLEVAIPVDKNRNWFWIPAKLPRDKPAANFPNDNLPSLQRFYKLPYTPPGFWVRLVSRLVVSLKQSDEETKILRSNSTDDGMANQEYRPRALTREHLLEDVVSGLNLKLKTLMYWQEGLLAIHDTGRILVEKHLFEDNTYGISILVKSHEFQEIGFIVDHIENLIKDWYPELLPRMKQVGFEDNDDDNVERLIPCPACAESPYVFDGHFYNVDDLKIAATYNGQHQIQCQFTGKYVPLKSLIPDVFLNDLQITVFEKAKLPHVKFTDEYSLGKGGFGEVYRATHKDENVAVKTLLSPGQFGHKSSALDRLEAFTLLENFSQFRIEVATMSRLKHSHVVQMKWACIQQLAFAMEYAPEGDMSSVLERKFAAFRARNDGRRTIHDTILDRYLTYKMVVQMASAVSYLHSHEMIYCDLKTDNALVFSLDLNDPINVKLTDYGISRQLIGMGGFGDAGPPGFCAPEILKHDIFDNKADWFSFGMVLYHLLSGKWPYDDLERSERMTATIQGIRPDFNFCGYKFVPSIPSLQMLMEECWKDRPKDRPGEKDVIAALGDAGMLCLRQVVHLETNESFQGSAVALLGIFPEQGDEATKNMLRIWSQSDRRYVRSHVYDFPTTTFVQQPIIVDELKEDDTNNVKSAQVFGNLHFFETMSRGKLHIYENNHGGKEPLRLQQKIPTTDPVSSLCYQALTQKSDQPNSTMQGRLFIGYPRNRVEMYEQDFIGNWEIKLSHKFDLHSKKEESCCNMTLAADDTQLWFSCGNTIFVSNLGDKVDFKSLDRNHQFYIVVNTSAIVTYMMPFGGYMWCHVADSLNAGSASQIVQIDISSRRGARRLEFKGHAEVGDGLECYEDRLEGKGNVGQGRPEDGAAVDVVEAAVDPYVSCFIVADSIAWVGTRRGKILVVDLSEGNFGFVIAVFSLENEESHLRPLVPGETKGPVRHLALVGNDKLVACQEVKGEEVNGRSSSWTKVSYRGTAGGSKYRLVVWDRWNLERFRWFDQVKRPLIRS